MGEIPEDIMQAAYDCARGIYLNVDDSGVPYLTSDDIEKIAKAILAERQERFEILQAAYRRGVDFAAEHLNLDGDQYEELWKYVPKAAYDYADKATSPTPPTPPKTGV